MKWEDKERHRPKKLINLEPWFGDEEAGPTINDITHGGDHNGVDSNKLEVLKIKKARSWATKFDLVQ